MNILVVGGYDSTDEQALNLKTYTESLGGEIIRQGHTLINGCQTEFDFVVAKAAWEYLTPFPQQRDVRIVSYVLSGSKPAHQFGKILNSRLTSWDPGDGDLFAPEPIQRADVVIVVRGFDGSFRAAHWAETIRKPVLPVAYFGGAAKKIYDNLSANFERNFGGRLSKADFEDLNAWGQNWPSFCQGGFVGRKGRYIKDCDCFDVLLERSRRRDETQERFLPISKRLQGIQLQLSKSGRDQCARSYLAKDPRTN